MACHDKVILQADLCLREDEEMYSAVRAKICAGVDECGAPMCSRKTTETGGNLLRCSRCKTAVYVSSNSPRVLLIFLTRSSVQQSIRRYLGPRIRGPVSLQHSDQCGCGCYEEKGTAWGTYFFAFQFMSLQISHIGSLASWAAVFH